MTEEVTIEDFRGLAPRKLGLLEQRGFLRAQELEESSPTITTLVYRGNHVGFVFSLDVRDQCLDAEVVAIKEGRILRNWDGGYSSNLFSHLVKHEGYRGGPSGIAKDDPVQAAGSKIEKEVSSWLNLLDTAGQRLLDDSVDSLPLSKR